MKVDHLLSIISVLLLFPASMAVARFVPPQDNAAFRRDQLPIDVDTMKQLSSYLTVLCTTLDPKDPIQQRTAAQFLALAQALDPINRAVQDMLEQWSKEQAFTPPDSSNLTLAKAKAWRIQSWLASDETGKDAKQLALCLGDVLARVDPHHPSAKNHTEELGTWTNWVASPADFTPAPSIVENTQESTESASDKQQSMPADEEKPANMEEEQAEFALQEASVLTPLFLIDEKTRTARLKITRVKLKAQIDSQHPEFRYDLQGVSPDLIRPALQSINQATVPRFKEEFGKLPKGGVIGLSLPPQSQYPIPKNGQHLSAAAAVLAHAALSGEKPTGIVVGIIRPDGKLSLPAHGWSMIRAITDAPSSRVVLPREAAELLPGMLALDELAFFMKHDIFLADNLRELIALSCEEVEPAMKSALTTFASIREKSTRNIGPFVANPHVRARLESTVQLDSRLISAQYLLLQATGRRPTQLPSKVVAHEIRQAIAPLLQVNNLMRNGPREEFNSSRVLAAHDSSRAALDPLDRMIAGNDRILYSQAIDLANTARTLARAMKKIGNHSNGTGGFHDKAFAESKAILEKQLPELEFKIERTLGSKADGF